VRSRQGTGEGLVRPDDHPVHGDLLGFRRVPRHVFLIVLAAACLAATNGYAGGEREFYSVSEAQLQSWVDQLDADPYAARQQASRQLRASGTAAIEPLRWAADGANAEVTRRAVDLLREFVLSDDAAAGRDAQAALESLVESANRSAAYRASIALRSRHLVALAKIRSLGGTVDESPNDGGEYSGPRVYLQKSWRGGDAGMECLRHLDSFEYLSLKDAPITGQGLEGVADFAQLKWLSLRGTSVNDETVAAVALQPHLEWLSLEETGVTDDGLRHLSGLSHLKKLYLGEAPITGPGLIHLKSMTQLRYLSLKDLEISDDSLAQLAELSNLEHLGLDDTSVTDAALVHLKNMDQLRTLWLTRSQVTDAGLSRLSHMKALARLYLDGTQITDAGLDHLKCLTQLDRLALTHTKVTDAGVQSLKSALPHVTVER